ncbi:MAG TPA: dehydrogenase E1 component subunit alpha/beta [Candidatus Dormibacteraeota bacterium]|nr:dehydrogenase E1 component subunit alpha/beta [Candidatus Dormibacteraeota bacterium]
MAQTVKTKGSEFAPDWHFQQAVDWRDTDIDEATLKQWFNYMLLGRQIDYRFQVLNRQGRAPFIISCAGHEAAQIGVSWPLKPKYDWLAPYYRDVVLCMRMGMTPLDLMLAVLAKPADPASGGKQTPGHFSDSRLNITSGGSPVAAQMVRGAGVAYALKMDGADKVLMTCYGEGAGSQGDAHEAFNFASIYKLPEIFVCENNGFAISTPMRKEYAIEHVAQRAAGYGFPGVTVDGRDPVTCYHVAKEAVARARAGQGPTLIECLVDRLGAHSSEDDQRRYRTQEEIDQLAQNDCLERFRKRLLEDGILTAKEVAEYEERVKDEVTKATKDGLDSPDAPAENAMTNVYAVDVPKAIEPAAGVEFEEMNMVSALRSCLTEEMERDERVMVLGEDVGAKGGVFLVTDGLYKKFGESRVIDTPLAESSIAGVALGLAVAGKRPVAEMQFTDFAHYAFNSIVNEAAKYRYRTDGDWSVPMVVRAPMGGHAHGALYHSQSIEARFATPGLKIVIPSGPYEAKGLLLAAIRDPDPVLFFEHKRLYRMFKEKVPLGEYLIPLSTARIAREGTDISVFCYGLMVQYAQEAAKALEESGVSVEIVDLRTVYPLDKDAIIASARKTGKCLVLYEDNFSVAIGSEVAALIADEAWRWLDAPVKRLGGLDVPAMPYAPAMEEAFMPTPEKITRALRELAAY